MSPSPWSFSFEPVFVVLAGLAAWLYARRWRDEGAPKWRAAVFAAGVGLVVVALNSPIGTIATEYLVLFHLLQNVMIGDWAPLGIVLGLTPAMRSALAERGGRTFASLTRPVVALPVWLVGWYVVHFGAVYDAAVRNPILLGLEHAFLIAIGLLFWWPVVCDVPRAVSTIARIGYVFAAFVSSVFLGLALTFAPPIYPFYEELDTRLWGIGAAKDQNLGGILMSSEQALVFFAAIVWLLVRLLREEAEAERLLTDEQRRAGLRRH